MYVCIRGGPQKPVLAPRPFKIYYQHHTDTRWKWEKHFINILHKTEMDSVIPKTSQNNKQFQPVMTEDTLHAMQKFKFQKARGPNDLKDSLLYDRIVDSDIK
jgi:hypothetical protein